ncbi:TRAP transporter 4TM/12TM fusion protein [Stella humosa]|uniref:TRAP transporter 4TM/12TM fusion protein n=1 Tax=Stella humosa TaxID=94 RepID=A0A3N1MIJ9_9PROT|nr:TRAP transporter fused permease subunit [Stella humosa]ROQ00966.1 TRAP transporter 4TM/12TM fusion protein [Stella humosa]BBK31333.1 ATP-binding protein [Stella humosa]
MTPTGGRGRGAAVVLACALASVAFHLYLVVSGLLPTLVTRPIHLALALPFVFLFAPGGRVARATGAVLCAVGVALCLWIAWERERLVDQYGVTVGWFQHGAAILLILIVLEMARRSVKAVMPTVAAICLAYGLFGQHLPGVFGHPGLPLDTILGTLVVAEGGLWGQLTGVSVDLVAPFLILGALVAAGDAGTGFMSFATRVAGRYRAGSAKVEVVASALYGTISGSASANVVTTGTMTIPAMIRAGYPRPFAAAVEAVASTGGQIMPPVMGAGVFLMAELIRVPYPELMVAATLPAFLFFAAAWIGTDHYAVRLGLTGLPASALPSWGTVGRTIPFFLVPLLIVIAILGFTAFTAQLGAAVAAAAAALLLLIDAAGRVDLGRWLVRLATATEDAARQIAHIAAVIICAGLIVGVFNMTGLGVKITGAILDLAGDRLWLALILTACACLVLGMELPTTAAYVICVAVAGPALGKLGLPPLQAHMFVFWYALLCTITPPVCGTVFIAAGIAQTPWLPVAGWAMRLGLGLFVVPLGFVQHPALLELGSTPILALAATAKVGLGLWLLSYAVIRIDRGLPRRALALPVGVALVLAGGF